MPRITDFCSCVYVLGCKLSVVRLCDSDFGIIIIIIITPVLDKLLEYKRSWIQHVNRMPRNILPRVMKHCCPTGRRNHGRLLKRLLDTWDRNGSTSGPTPWKIIDDDDDELLHWPCAGFSASTHTLFIISIDPNTHNPQRLVLWGQAFLYYCHVSFFHLW